MFSDMLHEITGIKPYSQNNEDPPVKPRGLRRLYLCALSLYWRLKNRKFYKANPDFPKTYEDLLMAARDMYTPDIKALMHTDLEATIESLYDPFSSPDLRQLQEYLDSRRTLH